MACISSGCGLCEDLALLFYLQSHGEASIGFIIRLRKVVSNA